MRVVPFLIGLTLTISCQDSHQKTDLASSGAGIIPGIPVGAVVKEYSDKPGLIGVFVNDLNNLSLPSGTLRDGKKEGVWVEYQPNGLLWKITSYVKNIKEGLFVEFTNTGQVLKRYYYHNDFKNGPYTEYFSASVKESRMYVNDKLEGLVKIYYDNGNIMEEGQYQAGLREGKSIWYDMEGNATIEYEFKSGENISIKK